MIIFTSSGKSRPRLPALSHRVVGGPLSAKGKPGDLKGVQCEACHGPGSEYKSMRVMKDPDLARENGLWEVTRNVCLRCHR